ncbi:orotidine 5'-phosphate decarboxylase / HUMPS family protein [Secundilactobacillus paracollinoides]|uniref:orotidine 5'-phosphate decarboxylase / HUMPS family protein n=1 Tax=Secundilactobacillus paracollinoides TaxID=240427 RepID=UPI003F732D5E
MKLQLAIDLEDVNGAINLIEKTKDSVDIFEYGTPLVINFGLEGSRLSGKNSPTSPYWLTSRSWMSRVTKSNRPTSTVLTSQRS